MQSSRLIAGSLLALSATGCFATKGDIRLLQDEVRAARASAAQADSARRRSSDSLTAALVNLAAVQANNARDERQAQQKTADDLKALAARVASSDIATKEQLKSLNDDLDQVREIARQNSRLSAAARAQLEQARPPAVTPPPADSTTPATPTAPSGPPGPATLLMQGKSLILNGSCSTARRNFQDVLTNFPDSPDAAEAQYLIAESYLACGDVGNSSKADSVYRLVVERFPKSDFAPISLFKRAEALRQANKMTEARPLYEKIVCGYPRSDVYSRALNQIGGQKPTCR